MPDASELERLYDTYAGGLFRYFLSFGGCEADAEDLLMELFARIAKTSPWCESAKEKSFVFRTAHNLAVDRQRRTQTRQATIAAATIEHSHQVGLPADADAALFNTELTGALAQLPPDQRSIVQLKLWDELTFDQIAEVQGIPANTAASRYRYGIEKLRTALRPLYEELQP